MSAAKYLKHNSKPTANWRNFFGRRPEQKAISLKEAIMLFEEYKEDNNASIAQSAEALDLKSS